MQYQIENLQIENSFIHSLHRMGNWRNIARTIKQELKNKKKTKTKTKKNSKQKYKQTNK